MNIFVSVIVHTNLVSVFCVHFKEFSISFLVYLTFLCLVVFVKIVLSLFTVNDYQAFYAKLFLC